MEVIGSYAPKAKTNVKGIRLRFSRVKFWFGVGADFNMPMRQLLALSGLIPSPPPTYGRRTKGHYVLLQEVLARRRDSHEASVEEYHKHAGAKGLHVR